MNRRSLKVKVKFSLGFNKRRNFLVAQFNFHERFSIRVLFSHA